MVTLGGSWPSVVGSSPTPVKHLLFKAYSSVG